MNINDVANHCKFVFQALVDLERTLSKTRQNDKNIFHDLISNVYLLFRHLQLTLDAINVNVINETKKTNHEAVFSLNSYTCVEENSRIRLRMERLIIFLFLA